MTRALLVLRHAEARAAVGGDAFLRPLTADGVAAARQVGREMRTRGWIPDVVLSSTATRARQTAEAIVTALAAAGAPLALDDNDRLYNASVETLLDALAGCDPDARRILIVGHNPGLAELVECLTGPVARRSDGRLLATASLAHLLPHAGWQELGPRTAALADLIHA